MSKEFETFLAQEGIINQVTCVYNLQQNGVIERKNRHIIEICRVVFNEKNMPDAY